MGYDVITPEHFQEAAAAIIALATRGHGDEAGR